MLWEGFLRLAYIYVKGQYNYNYNNGKSVKYSLSLQCRLQLCIRFRPLSGVWEMHMCASCGERRSWYQAAAFFWKSRPARSFGYYYKNWHAVKKSQGTSANQLFPHSRPVGAVSSHDLTSEGLPRACLTTPAVAATFMLMHITHLQHVFRFQEPFSAAATTRYYTGLQEILDIKILSAVFPFLARELLVTCGSFFQGQGSFSCSANQTVPWRAYKYENENIEGCCTEQNTYLWGRELG